MAQTILVIDDDHDFSDAVTTMLQSQGYAVITADNGKEGFKQAKEKKPDLILLDVMMTQKTEGFDAARNLKSDAATKDIPVVLVTGIRKAMNLAFGFEPDEDWLPVKTVLEKPVKPDALLKAIKQELK